MRVGTVTEWDGPSVSERARVGKRRRMVETAPVILVGRKPVLEALRSPALDVDRVTIASSILGDFSAEIEALAQELGVPLERAGDRRLDALAGDDRQHQGVVAQVTTPEPIELGHFLSGRDGRNWVTNVLLLDHVHNPANVGMILRTAAGAGIDGVIVPRQGTATIGPLTVKAGAGVIWSVPILDVESVEDAVELLQESNFSLVGLDATGEDLWDSTLPDRAVFVLGNETVGLSATTTRALDMTVSLPLANGVESLNVAATASIVSYEIVRRRLTA